jgi:hypothetical protein
MAIVNQALDMYSINFKIGENNLSAYGMNFLAKMSLMKIK